MKYDEEEREESLFSYAEEIFKGIAIISIITIIFLFMWLT